jgi:hypothetical protein
MYYSEVMCRQKVDTPWSIYRDFTVHYNHYITNITLHDQLHFIYLLKIVTPLWRFKKKKKFKKIKKSK